MKFLVCTETRSGKIEAISLEMLAAARTIAAPGDEVVALVVGDSATDAAARLGAADRVIAAIAPALSVPTAEAYARIARDVMATEAPDLIVMPYSATGLDVAPELAARCELPIVAYVVRLDRGDDGVAATSQIYGGKVMAKTRITGPAIAMLNPGSFPEAAASQVAAGALASLDPTPLLSNLRVELLGEDQPDLAEIDIATAERIVCVGRGIGDEGSIEIARELAGLLGAEIAGSRPVVDNGWLPKLRQVGKSGRKVKPRLYLALGVSGAPEHLEGMSRSDLIIAVNTDPKAPIFGVAHYGATCDLFDLVAALNDRLRAPAGS
ncbi:electron transfer flavoprotein subunit alpha/FixB family protein [Kaistia algarum]|uniref:electron transfer flavoprotein subunit alpha/FixB family protein n=1 Tax=Kaistia algarum TaxID=2083279 RepID=UPI000CE7C0DC|nr:electron transfer flavoprotein subunit alpha/FixB family protein [Kaistia algarum]MCX5515432.1 electron transfer flavoprotein subunit alpha/FixB family protein [Kaistia algarum]PPE78509.1 electron transfer flavoprotein subunit alpha/FixB family protein [Kaistia algarum]